MARAGAAIAGAGGLVLGRAVRRAGGEPRVARPGSRGGTTVAAYAMNMKSRRRRAGRRRWPRRGPAPPRLRVQVSTCEGAYTLGLMERGSTREVHSPGDHGQGEMGDIAKTRRTTVLGGGSWRPLAMGKGRKRVSHQFGAVPSGNRRIFSVGCHPSGNRLSPAPGGQGSATPRTPSAPLVFMRDRHH
eukprot:SAG22_NODE_1745_length_3666_cov_1.403140_1_plen_186_part_10